MNLKLISDFTPDKSKVPIWKTYGELLGKCKSKKSILPKWLQDENFEQFIDKYDSDKGFEEPVFYIPDIPDFLAANQMCRDFFGLCGDGPESESDRGVILVAGALIENILGYHLFNDLSLRDQFKGSNLPALFGPFGSLNRFDRRIEYAWHLGLITPEMASDLAVLKTYRNVAAHTVSPFCFDNRTIQILSKMHCYKCTQDNPRQAFIAFIRFLVLKSRLKLCNS